MQVLPIPVDYAAPSVCTHCGLYAGATMYVVGYGTSLMEFDWTRLNGRITIALNNAVRRFAPTYHLYSDFSIRSRYWKHEYQDGTTIVCQDDVARQARETKWRHYDKIRTFCRVSDNLRDIPRNNDQLYVERTVATAATMLAWKLGAARIYLLGVDGYRLLKQDMCYAGGTAHASQPPRDTDKIVGDIVVTEMHGFWNLDFLRLKDYFLAQAALKQNVPEVIIANPRATITAWPRCTIEEALR